MTIVEKSDPESDGENTFQVSTKGLKNAQYVVSVNNIKISVIADSGSTITLFERSAYYSLGKPKLTATSVKMYTYKSKEPLPLQGAINVQISYNGHTVAETPYICPGTVATY